MVKKATAIMAVDDNGGVGKNNDLPWPKIKEDLQHFKNATLNTFVVMGSKTWESLGKKKLPNRTNVVLSSNINIEGPDVVISAKDDNHVILEYLESIDPDKNVCVIGGAGVVESFAKDDLIDMVILTHIKEEYECDTFLNLSFLKDFYVAYEEVIKENPEVVVKYYKKIED